MYDPSGFNPRSPCGERHPHDFVRPDVRLVSTHAPLAGSDSWPRGSGRAARGFNPRSPCGERLPVGSVVWGSNSFNPRSPCGERLGIRCPELAHSPVSTHAPLAGSDVRSGRLSLQVFLFQPTLPLRGATATANMFIDDGGFQPTLPLRGATLALAASLPPPMFQPTLPLRGATWWTGQRKSPRCRFNPRSPCGERPDDPTVVSRGVAVSTHAPLAGSDSP